MLKTRVMPCLLVRDRALVKTVRFRKPAYVGDPLNAIRIYNELEVDELILLDIGATPQGRPPPFDLVREAAGECFMPLTYGGGVRSLDDLARLFSLGVEKVVLDTAAVEDPELLRGASRRFGSQSVVVAIDVKRGWLGRYAVRTRSGRKATGLDPLAHARRVEELGAGEILLNSIDRDGTFTGYDLELLRRVCDAVSVPVIACGGAGSIQDFGRAVREGGASAVAAGSLVVYQGPHRAVLINFPSPGELEDVLGGWGSRFGSVPLA